MDEKGHLALPKLFVNLAKACNKQPGLVGNADGLRQAPQHQMFNKQIEVIGH
jgi:hypothetical protein